MDKERYNAYIGILKDELVPAMGCTEPIAVAYAAALARQVLGQTPQKVDIFVSANIIKNVKSVIVPNTGSLRGIAAAAAAGIVAGNSELKLEVLASVAADQIPSIKAYLECVPIVVALSENEYIFDIQITVEADEHTAFVQIAGSHTNVIQIIRDGKILQQRNYEENSQAERTDRKLLTVEGIIEFADTVAVEDVKEILDRQIQMNTAIAQEGLRGKWGASIGKVLLSAYD
ncbi:MAG: hypothetical protein K2O45_08905 [Oscillospiraceae bacterium]|nr:hypothetical protein [Oscillospiraceae bacterium]